MTNEMTPTEENSIDRDDAWRVAAALMWYVANRSLDEFLAFFFDGTKHKSIDERPVNDPYVAEWAKRWRSRDYCLLFGNMDFHNQERFVAEALRVYEAESANALRQARRFFDGRGRIR